MLFFSWQEAAKFTLPRSNYLIYSIFIFWDWNAGWGCQGDKCWRLQGWCGAPHLPTVDSSSGPLCTRLLGTVKCPGKQYPGRCMLTEQKLSLSLNSLIPQISKSGLRNAAFLQHESGLCWGLQAPWFTGLLPWHLHPCLLSALEECFKKTWNQTILLEDCLLSFSKQGWKAVSELSIIIRVEQWSLLLTGSFSEPCCGGFVIISQG